MTAQQGYVSEMLTHFVGRGMHEAVQCQILVKDLRTGWLTHPEPMAGTDEAAAESIPTRPMGLNTGRPIKAASPGFKPSSPGPPRASPLPTTPPFATPAREPWI